MSHTERMERPGKLTPAKGERAGLLKGRRRRMERDERLGLLLGLVMEGQYATQEELVEALEAQGAQVTQSSVSRDIRELGLRKRGGVYVAPPEMLVGPSGLDVWAFVQSVLPAGDHMVVIKCRAGTAQTLGVELDASKWPGVVGTIAGDDTIFVAVNSPSASLDVMRRVRFIAGIN